MNNDRTYDVIITGGGIMGSSTAYYLSRMAPGLKIAVVERDPSYARASTTLSMSNVRIQFSLKENILISQYAFQVLDAFEAEMTVEDRRPRIYFHRDGNLFLVGEENLQAARRAYDLQLSLGCRVQWWSPEQIKAHYPLYDTSGIVGGTFGPDDGHFDAYAALMAYKAKARSQGAHYLAGEEVKRSMEWLIKRLIKVGEKVAYHGRRWYVHVASAFPLARHYRAVFG